MSLGLGNGRGSALGHGGKGGLVGLWVGGRRGKGESTSMEDLTGEGRIERVSPV